MISHPWTEYVSKALIREAGIPVPEDHLVTTAEAAQGAAESLGYPVAMKVSHATLSHKSDHQGVVLAIDDPAQAMASARRLLALVDGAQVLVEPMAPPGLDLILAGKRDPVFGPVIMVGLGGIYTEVMADTAVFVGVPDGDQAAAMLRRLKGHALLQGGRGQEPVMVATVVAALVALGTLMSKRPELAEVEINPFRVWPNGGLALDALAVPVSAPAPRPTTPIPGPMAPFFTPRSVAVVGPSRTAMRAGNIIIRNCLTLGYSGAIFPVNPGGGTIEGLRAFTSISQCPEPPELAVLAVPYHQVLPVMVDVAAMGIRHVIVVSGGFSDSAEAGQYREAELLAFCREHGIRLMGPNSIGTLDSRSGFTTAIGILPPVPPTGASVFGQSGTLSTGYTLEEVTVHGRGFARVACLGNKPDVDESDLLAESAEDEQTRVVGIYLESISSGSRFVAAARQAALRKPVFVLKSGRTSVGARAAATHTGALAGEDRIYEAVFAQCGLQRVRSLPELFDAMRTADMCPVPRGNRVGVVSLTGVGCVLAADACCEEGLELAEVSADTQVRLQELVPEWAPIRNPADIWSTIEQVGPAQAYQAFCEVMIADEQVDMLLVISVLLEEGAFDMGRILAPLRQRFSHKPIVAAWVGGRRDLLDDFRRGLGDAQIPAFEGPTRAVRMLGHLARRRVIETSFTR